MILIVPLVAGIANSLLIQSESDCISGLLQLCTMYFLRFHDTKFWISTDFIVVDTWGYGYHP